MGTKRVKIYQLIRKLWWKTKWHVFMAHGV